MAAPFPLADPPTPDEPRNGPGDNASQEAKNLESALLAPENISAILDFFQLLDEWDRQEKIL